MHSIYFTGWKYTALSASTRDGHDDHVLHMESCSGQRVDGDRVGVLPQTRIAGLYIAWILGACCVSYVGFIHTLQYHSVGGRKGDGWAGLAFTLGIGENIPRVNFDWNISGHCEIRC